MILAVQAADNINRHISSKQEGNDKYDNVQQLQQASCRCIHYIGTGR